jgi:hypothetical protein
MVYAFIRYLDEALYFHFCTQAQVQVSSHDENHIEQLQQQLTQARGCTGFALRLAESVGLSLKTRHGSLQFFTEFTGTLSLHAVGS